MVFVSGFSETALVEIAIAAPSAVSPAERSTARKQGRSMARKRKKGPEGASSRSESPPQSVDVCYRCSELSSCALNRVMLLTMK